MMLIKQAIRFGILSLENYNSRKIKKEEKDTDKDEDDKVTLDTAKLSKNEWTKANYFALLTMKKNCDEEPLTKFKLARKAYNAYRALKSHYEGKTVTDLGAVLANIIRITYDDRQNTVDGHITEYEKQWDLCVQL
jgi:hypothetical protein